MKENCNTTPLYCPRIPDLVSQWNTVSVRSLVTHECCGLSAIYLKSWIVSLVVILINNKCWFNHGVRPFRYQHILSPIKSIFSITVPNEVPLFPTSLAIRVGYDQLDLACVLSDEDACLLIVQMLVYTTVITNMCKWYLKGLEMISLECAHTPCAPHFL